MIQIQTPFGGGKTHALIAMYHKAAEWDATRVVVVGTPLAPTETIWGLMAEQLAGSRAGFEGSTAPGREALRNLLAAQTLAFVQELTEAASTLERVCLAVTLPSSLLEHYDEGAERLFRQLQKVAGRVEKIYAFLVALESERPALETLMWKRLAFEMIEGDRTLNLNPDQRKEVKDELKKAQGDLAEAVRRTYRQLFIPTRDGLKELDLGIPTLGAGHRRRGTPGAVWTGGVGG